VTAGAAAMESRPAPRVHTQFAFTLPVGYIDDTGRMHREGVMRLATARDEIGPQRDLRVRENPAYLSVLLLSRVVTRLGSLSGVDAGVIEGMFAADLAFLQDLYRRINQEGHAHAEVVCPGCQHRFSVDVAGAGLGES
jgi:hypothetical protein